MLRKIGTDDMRKKMGEILDCVNLRGDEFIIQRKQKPIAGLIPIRKLNAIQEISKNFIIDFLETNETTLTQDEVDALADMAKHKSRKNTSGKNTKRASNG